MCKWAVLGGLLLVGVVLGAGLQGQSASLYANLQEPTRTQANSHPAKKMVADPPTPASAPTPSAATAAPVPTQVNVLTRPSQGSSLKLTGAWKAQAPELFRVSGEANKGYRGIDVPYELWIDDNLWEMTEPLNTNAEMSFRSKNNLIAAIVVARKDAFPLAQLEDILVSSAEGELKDVAIVEEKKRSVNGIELLAIHWRGSLNGHETDFLSYVYSGQNGTVMVHTYTPANLYTENEQLMEKFLNGLTIQQNKG